MKLVIGKCTLGRSFSRLLKYSKNRSRLPRAAAGCVCRKRPMLRLPVGKQLTAISVWRVYTANPSTVSATFLLAGYMPGIKFAVGLVYAVESISAGFSRTLKVQSYLYGNRQSTFCDFYYWNSWERSDNRAAVQPDHFILNNVRSFCNGPPGEASMFELNKRSLISRLRY